MNTKTLLTALASAGLFAAGSATADTIQVDITGTGGNTGTTQAGWSAWSPESGGASVASTDATDGTIEASLSGSGGAINGRNYGIYNVTDPGSLTNADVWADQWFVGNSMTGEFTLTLDDLKAGTYTFTSYHYADDLSSANSSKNDEGNMNVFVGGVDTGQDVTFISGGDSEISGGGNPSSSDLDTFGKVTFQFTVANDGDSVAILYDNVAATVSSTNGDTVGINGFELTLVPEPGSLALLAMGGLCVLRRRRDARP